jgi:hypothetical protein
MADYEYRMKYFGETEEQARAKIEAMKEPETSGGYNFNMEGDE